MTEGNVGSDLSTTGDQMRDQSSAPAVSEEEEEFWKRARPASLSAVREAIRSAQSGDLDSQYLLGLWKNDVGERRGRDLLMIAMSAADHWRRPAEVGHVPSQIGMQWVSQIYGDREAELRWLRAAATQGDARSAEQLADRLHLDGETAAAVPWWTRAAQAGRPEAMASLALAAHLEGDKDEERAWLGPAADAGSVLGGLWLGRRLIARGDVDEGRRLLERASARGDDLRAFTYRQIGNRLKEVGDVDGARAWWFLRVKSVQDRDCMMSLSMSYRRAAVPDPDAHLHWAVRAASQGHPIAMAVVATRLKDAGYGAVAADWWRASGMAGAPTGTVTDLVLPEAFDVPDVAPPPSLTTVRTSPL